MADSFDLLKDVFGIPDQIDESLIKMHFAQGNAKVKCLIGRQGACEVAEHYSFVSIHEAKAYVELKALLKGMSGRIGVRK
jgi:acid phosphatase class B